MRHQRCLLFIATLSLLLVTQTSPAREIKPTAFTPPQFSVIRFDLNKPSTNLPVAVANSEFIYYQPPADAAKANPDEVKKLALDAGKDAKDAKDEAIKGQDRADSSWMLISSALVMLMVPGLALFYGGMVRKKNILATMMQSYAALAIVGLYWVMCGYGLAFGPSINFFKVSFWGVSEGGLVGWHPDLFFCGIAPDQKLPGNGITVYLHCMFQGMFAIITPALISGALAERIRFWPFCIYMILWVTVVYCPLAHMVWANDFFYDDPLDEAKGLGGSPIGFLGKLGALDFAGGTVVHIAAGTAGLACALVLRRRLGYPKTVVHPNSMVLTLLGAGLLWFGWFGFNGGSALNSSPLAGSAFAATQAAAAAAGLSWIFVEWLFKGKPTALGMASGIVAGLVAVTPASGFVFIWGGVAIGVLAGVLCYFAVSLKGLFGYDDSLDAFGVHAVGGFLGAILTGFFCYAQIQPASADGYFAVPSVLAAGPVLDEKIKKVEADLPAIKKAAEAADAELTKAGDKADDKLKESTAVAKGKLSRLEAKLEGLKKDKETNTKAVESYKKDNIGPMTQVMKQVKAACLSAGFAFVASLLLAILVQILTLGNFTTSAKEETEGLDHTEHGEVGFDFGLGIESSTSGMGEPKAAKMPPGGKRFSIEIEGTENGSLMKAWSELCVPQTGAVDADFKAVYPHVTTVQGTKFYFRGGDSKKIASHLSALFKKKLGKPVTVKINET